jgi:DNA (cytosine-5)-methyltransferase 1
VREREREQLRVGTLFSGIGAFEQALKKLKIPHNIIFANDIDKYCKQSYEANYQFGD